MLFSLKALRINAGFTQADVAKLLKVSLPTFRDIESGKRDIKLSTALKLMEIYHIESILDVDWPSVGQLK